jgi:acetyl-CoA C-acetyltransferase
MGTFAEDCAAKYSFTREAQDAFAIASRQRAQKANKRRVRAGRSPGHGQAGKGDTVIDTDEQPVQGATSTRSRR